MGNTNITGPLLSQEEIRALFSFESSQEDSNPGDSCAAGQAETVHGGSNTNGASPLPAAESTAGRNFAESRNEIGFDSNATSTPSLLNTDEVAHLKSLQGLLTLEAILRSCRQIFKEHFPLRRISLVQPRSDISTAVVHCLNEDRDLTFVGPQVIPLEPSRLKECLLNRQPTLCSVPISELDNSERDYLFASDPNQCNASIIYLPLMLHDKPKGVLALSLSEAVRVNADKIAFLSQMAGHIAIAIENWDRFCVERRRSRLFTLANKISKLAASQIEDKLFFSETCELLRKSFDHHSVQIWLEACNRLELMGNSCRIEEGDSASQRIPSLVQECARRMQTVCNDELHSEFENEQNREIDSQLAIPIHFGGKCTGVLYLDSGRSDTITGEDVNGMESAAVLIASRLYNLQTFKNAQRSGEYLQAVLEAANDWAILSTDIHGYVITCSVGLQRVFRLSQQEILGTDLLNLFTNLQIQRDLIAFINGNNTASCLERLHVPQENGKTTAYLDLTFQRVHDHEKQHIGFLCVVRDVTKKLLLLQKLKELSITDDVTGLYNQRGFLRALRREIRRCQKSHLNLSLCFLDLDNLKRFNDTYGHLSGSQALRETAGLIKRLTRSSDICCRYGGDEFAIVMPQTSKTEASFAIERIRVLLNEHFQGKMTGSFGIADMSNKITEAIDLLAKADKAMYRAKSQGKNCIVVSE